MVRISDGMFALVASCFGHHAMICPARASESVTSIIRDRLFVVKVWLNATITAKHNTINGINR